MIHSSITIEEVPKVPALQSFHHGDACVSVVSSEQKMIWRTSITAVEMGEADNMGTSFSSCIPAVTSERVIHQAHDFSSHGLDQIVFMGCYDLQSNSLTFVHETGLDPMP